MEKFNDDGSFNIERNSIAFERAGQEVQALKRRGIGADVSITYVEATREVSGGYSVTINGSEHSRHVLSVEAERAAYEIAVDLWKKRRKSWQRRGLISEQILTRREELGLSQDALAKKVGTTQGRIGDWERGDHTPTVAWLKKLATVLGPFVIGGEE